MPLGYVTVSVDKKSGGHSGLLRTKNAPEAEHCLRREYRKGWEL